VSTWHPQVLKVLIVQQSHWNFSSSSDLPLHQQQRSSTSPAAALSHFTSSSDLPLHLWQAMAVGSRKQV